MHDPNQLAQLVTSIATFLAAVAAVITAVRTKTTTEKKLDEHSKDVHNEIGGVRQEINGKVDRLMDETRRAAIAETKLRFADLSADVIPTANPEEGQ